MDRGVEELYPVGSRMFFMISHASDQYPAVGYWTGLDGGTHAHADIGPLERRGDCWVNAKSRICFYER